MSNCPPKKRDWTPGKPQIGVFIRTPMGSTLDGCIDAASEDEQTMALILVSGLVRKLPPEVRALLTREWTRLTANKQTPLSAKKK